MILHLRVVPGLGIAVETRTRPEIAGRPVIMGGLPHQRGAVQEANVRAQHAGVQIGMTLAQAYHHCPDGIFLPPDLPRYQGVWEEICALLAGYTPLVEPLESGQVVADLSGHQYRWSDGRQAAYVVRRRIYESTGILPHLGVASNRLVAQLAAAQAGIDGITVIEPGQEQSFLADLPLTLFPGVDPRLALTLHVLGLITARQFAALPRGAVKQRFGTTGERLHDATRGLDSRPVTPPPVRPSVVIRRQCDEGIAEEAVTVLQRLAEECAGELQARRLAGRLVKLTLIWEAFRTPNRTATAPAQLFSDKVDITKSEMPANMMLPVAGREEATVRGGYRMEHTLPVPYRIHSMLPQPGNPRPEPAPVPVPNLPAPIPSLDIAPIEPFTRVGTMVRTAIADAEPLFQRAQQLLQQHWPRPVERAPRLQAIELEVSEFEQPTQLSFALLNRLDQSGGLAGMDPSRLAALRRQEDILAARYGETSFRHLAHIDPASILTERRFRWGAGLPWSTPAAAKASRRPTTRRRA